MRDGPGGEAAPDKMRDGPAARHNAIVGRGAAGRKQLWDTYRRGDLTRFLDGEKFFNEQQSEPRRRAGATRSEQPAIGNGGVGS